jgi:hypothetical protein
MGTTLRIHCLQTSAQASSVCHGKKQKQRCRVSSGRCMRARKRVTRCVGGGANTRFVDWSLVADVARANPQFCLGDLRLFKWGQVLCKPCQPTPGFAWGLLFFVCFWEQRDGGSSYPLLRARALGPWKCKQRRLPAVMDMQFAFHPTPGHLKGGGCWGGAVGTTGYAGPGSGGGVRLLCEARQGTAPPWHHELNPCLVSSSRLAARDRRIGGGDGLDPPPTPPRNTSNTTSVF